MIFLPEFENRILIIKYGNGSSTGEMKIVVQRFMEEQTVTKIKKLLNIIRTSHDPDVEQVIADFCKQWLSQYEAGQKMLANDQATRSSLRDFNRNQKVKVKYERVLKIISQW